MCPCADAFSNVWILHPGKHLRQAMEKFKPVSVTKLGSDGTVELDQIAHDFATAKRNIELDALEIDPKKFTFFRIFRRPHKDIRGLCISMVNTKTV